MSASDGINNMILPLDYSHDTLKDLAFLSFLNNVLGLTMSDYDSLDYGEQKSVRDQFHDYPSWG